MKIKAKPMQFLQVIDFDAKDIKQVYYGQLNCCRCGCSGEYYEPGVTPKADKFIDEALNKLKYYSDKSEVVYEHFTYKDPSKNELYLEFETHGRFNGSAMQQELMGYAFYIKDVDTK